MTEWFRKTFGKQAPEPEKMRIVALNNPEFNAAKNYPRNGIRTSKYSALTFLPMNLFEQFHRFANLYFLLLIILQFIPQISSLNPVTSMIPLVFVLSVTAVKDGIDDWRRAKSDKKINKRKVTLIRNGRQVDETWQNVVVGDIVLLRKDDAVTADMVILLTSEPTGFCLIETAELDGETNLKVRQATDVVSQGFGDKTEQIAHYKCEVHCEPPNNNLNKFEGVLYLGPVSIAPDPNQFAKTSLSNDNLLLRGCTLRATEWVYGLVIFTGKDTKLMKNSGAKRHKVTSVDIFLNRAVIGIFVSMLVCCLICMIYDLTWERDVGIDFQDYQPWEPFMPKDNLAAAFLLRGVMTFLSYFILFNTFVPVSLYVSVEIVRLAQSIMITWDKDMWYHETDIAADVRNTSLSEELGQIQYIFSDKTGTLTQNVMTLNKCSIYGLKYGDVIDPVSETEEDPYDSTGKYPRLNLLKTITPDADPEFVFYDTRLIEAIHRQASIPRAMQTEKEIMLRHYFRSMALCSTVVPSKIEDPCKKDGSMMLSYQAQSPDENALISAARSFGFVLLDRDATSLTIAEPTKRHLKSRKLEFPLLHLLDFDNVRKRMSVIIREPDNPDQIILYCKGADSSLFPYAAAGQEEMIETTLQHLHDFAAKGLRTLVFGMKVLSRQQWEEWKEKCDEAATSVGNRDEKVREVYCEIEKDFIILGASAIEDKLQDGVPLAIKQLITAGIRMWVLTGDKQETAVNIGYSCNLLNQDTNLTVINDDDAAVPGKVAGMLAKMYREMEGRPYEPPEQASVSSRNMSPFQRLRRALPKPRAVLDDVTAYFRSFWPSSSDPDGDDDENAEHMFALSLTGSALDAILPHLNKKKKDDKKGNANRNNQADNDEVELSPEVSNMMDLFVKVAGRCTTVICCRMTPLAKAQVVELFRKYLHARTCSIGDGANDVPMIRSANIGVGIAGREGLQAVLSSDFAIAQFRFLAKLLLVHGRWSYVRMATFIRYFLYKNLTFTIGHFFFAFYCGGTAQTAFDPLFVGLFNTIYTAIPCIVLGATDQEISAKGFMEFPMLYEVGMKGKLLNLKVLVATFIDSVFSAACVFFLHYGTDVYGIASVYFADLRTFAFTMGFTSLVLVTLRCAIVTSYWTVWSHIALWGSLAIYWVTVFGFDPLIYALFSVHYEYEGAQYAALGWAPTWLASIGAITMSMLPGIFLSYFSQCLNPTLSEAVREKENNERPSVFVRCYRKVKPERPESTGPIEIASPAAIETFSFNESLRKRKQRRPRLSSESFQDAGTGYGYSHTEGFGDLLTGHNRGSVAPIYITHF